jgi:hypothetical protein
MKKMLLSSAAVLLPAATTIAQEQGQSRTRQRGRGRGGAPFAWNDQNKDGICDVTGRPVGQGRPIGFGRGRGRGIGR